MIDRRTFLYGLGVGLFAAPLAIEAQTTPEVPRIGYLAVGPPACPPTRLTTAFRQGLLDLGYVEGRDIILDRQCFATGSMAGEVVDAVLKAKPRVLVASGPVPALAIKERAPHLPVVFADVPDPVGVGLVQSLARPGTNMTGLSSLALDLYGKGVQVLKEMLPKVRVISTLETRDTPITDRFRSEIDRAGTAAGWQVRHLTVSTASDLPGAFEAMKRDGAQAFILMPIALFWTERAQLANLAAKHRLPGLYAFTAQVEAGGLISYGADHADMFRRVAGYVVKILRGARPADLPVEEPTKFELVINLKTAKALGLTIPPSLLLRADQVIE